jgi:HEAT repeat protein
MKSERQDMTNRSPNSFDPIVILGFALVMALALFIGWVKVAKSADTRLSSPTLTTSDVDRLITQLTTDRQTPQARLENINALTQIGPAAIPKLLPLLQHPDAGIRQSAVWALSNMGRSAASALPALLPLLKDPAAEVRMVTAWAVGELSESTASTIVHLRPLLQDRDFRVRAEAVQAFSNHPDADDLRSVEDHRAVADLIPLIDDQNALVRRMTVRAVGEIGAGAKSAVPQLILRLKDSDRLVRGNAITALVRVTADDPAMVKDTIVPQLIPLLDDPDELVKSTAETVLSILDINPSMLKPI